MLSANRTLKNLVKKLKFDKETEGIYNYSDEDGIQYVIERLGENQVSITWKDSESRIRKEIALLDDSAGMKSDIPAELYYYQDHAGKETISDFKPKNVVTCVPLSLAQRINEMSYLYRNPEKDKFVISNDDGRLKFTTFDLPSKKYVIKDVLTFERETEK